MDDKQDSEKLHKAVTDLSRRDFIAVSVAAGLAAAAGSAFAAQPVVETEVTIKTPDGTCDAAFIHPPTGSHPGVLIWTDAFGLRPAMRDIGKRIAAEGYSVLVPNPFYRVAKAPVFDSASSFNFQNQADMSKLQPLMGSVNAPGAAEKDAVAYIAFLDAQSQVNKAKKIGTQGYCMGGRLVVVTAAALPDRVGAGASFHGGGLVTDSLQPAFTAPKIKARCTGIASDDDQRQPEAKAKLRSVCRGERPAEMEVYPAGTAGVPDMPTDNGAPIQPAGGRTRVEQACRSVQDGTCLVPSVIDGEQPRIRHQAGPGPGLDGVS
jgi:carboxymethylenebutenolidase